jgi:glycosyltransferase involved in cell wall biosynthesis
VGHGLITRRVLVGAYVVPEPDRDSGSRRIDDMLSFLLEDGWAVTFVTTRPNHERRYVEALQRRGVAVFHLDVRGLEDLASAVSFDVAILAFWPTAELFLPPLRRVSPGTRIIVDSIDLHFLRHARRIAAQGAHGGSLDDAFADQLIGELNAYAAADAVITVSAKEAGLIDDLLAQPGLARVVPDYEEMAPSGVPFGERRGILFVGSFRHNPNRTAIDWLCRQVVPRLPAGTLDEHPISIVGDALDDDIRAMAGSREGIRMVGWVPTLDPWLAATRISVLPLVSGAGTKRKLIQALMTGTPTVSTSVGVEGFDLVHGEHLLVADDPTEFADDIVTLLGDEALHARLAREGRARMIRDHGRDRAHAAIIEVLQAALARPPKGPRLPQRDEARHLERLGYQYEQGRTLQGTDGYVPAAQSMPVVEPPRTVDARNIVGSDVDVRLIAFYLPQFHPIPENDDWWGEGFTEWTNVRTARPLFAGHRQPREPGELGYYDLRDPEIRDRQASLARAHGIHGFCYYHYWFGGKRLLERPFDEVLASGRPDLPFALCWANESWSRRWDGSEQEILQPQAYSPEDDLAHIRALLPALHDQRAITVGGEPLLLIYQGWVLPDAQRLTDTWRTEALRSGLSGLHLLSVETGYDAGWDATAVGFDGKVRFQPQFTTLAATERIHVGGQSSLAVYDYRRSWPVLSEPPLAPYPTYEVVFPGWDNTPRRGTKGVVVHDATPELYGRWLTKAVERARWRPPEERVVFINAWNEWAEGAYLEPDTIYGRDWLEATRRAVATSAAT